MKLWPFSGGERKQSSWELLRDFLLSGSRSASGKAVTRDSAIRVSAVLACARVIANGLAQVPLKLYEEESKKPQRDHELYDLLHRKPNDWQTSFEFRETMGLHLVLAGRFVAFKNVVRGKLVELIPFEPDDVRVIRRPDLSLVYEVTGADGKKQEFPAEAIWHVRGPSWNSWEAWNLIRLAREAIGLSIALEEHHSLMHANGVSSSGVYSVEGTLNETQYNQLREFIQKNYTGAAKGLPMIVDRGATWLNTAMTGVDAQHLETRRFQIEEVCRHLGVQPIMVYQSDKATTYASAEQMFIMHVVHTMAPWYERVEQSIDVNLLTRSDRQRGIYAKFSASALMRGAMKDRAEYFARALGAGGAAPWMTQDEVRAYDELPPLGGAAAQLPPRLGATPPAKPTDTPADDPTLTSEGSPS